MENLELITAEIKKSALLVEYLKPAKRGYVCPACGNGSGENGTGAIISADGTRLLCGKCQRGLTNIDIVAAHLGKRTTGEDYIDVVRYSAEKLGIEMKESRVQIQQLGKKSDRAEIGVETEITKIILEDIAKGKNYLSELEEKEKRGLTEKTLKEFEIGVDFRWTPPKERMNKKSVYESGRIIIPHLTNQLLPNIPLTYCAALLQTERERLEALGKDYLKYLYGGKRTPFGLNTLREDAEKVFVTEGEYDALSIWQATGGKYPCLATGGTAENGIIEVLEKYYEGKKPLIYFVGDNDEAGKKFAEAISAKLRVKGFVSVPIYFGALGGEKVDANKLLVELGEEELKFKLNVAVSEAQEKLEKIAREEEKRLFGEESAEYYKGSFIEYLENRKCFEDRKTGFENLDAEMGSILPGVYILGGLAALGKTSFSWQILEQMAREGENCIYCSYEMSAGELYSKRIARAVYLLEKSKGTVEDDKILTASQIGRNKFYNHKENFEEVLKNLREEKISLRVWELEDTDVEKLFERLRKFCEVKGKPPVVVIDYLQILAGNVENVKVAIDDILRRLKNFQRKTNTTFIVISSLNRANYSTEISFESFKESGGIEYSADVVWGLQLLIEGQRNHEAIEKAKKEIPRQIQLKCLKNRNGRNYDVGFLYYPNADYFKEIEEYGEYTDYKLNENGQMIEVIKPKKKKSY